MASNKRQARDESEDEQESSSKCIKSSAPTTPKKARKTAAASNPETPSKQAWDADQDQKIILAVLGGKLPALSKDTVKCLADEMGRTEISIRRRYDRIKQRILGGRDIGGHEGA
ncbi:hypothetical protein FA10DRAFT_300415 [Acaromyces ingoldii]|uniref:Myb-like domain-containing protein n=1 Tax=Acaromyces ingoldii TaxID=215250 RepID=A0A316YRB8_9BASI|nr:hypothetical protein FA10DRAFT_300415 [Acaromyces ingoldii]PWN91839.1 hypothetical protein FA10DRAFT_300415 [Acaromyces ingoldii]